MLAWLGGLDSLETKADVKFFVFDICPVANVSSMSSFDTSIHINSLASMSGGKGVAGTHCMRLPTKVHKTGEDYCADVLPTVRRDLADLDVDAQQEEQCKHVDIVFVNLDDHEVLVVLVLLEVGARETRR